MDGFYDIIGIPALGANYSALGKFSVGLSAVELGNVFNNGNLPVTAYALDDR